VLEGCKSLNDLVNFFRPVTYANIFIMWMVSDRTPKNQIGNIGVTFHFSLPKTNYLVERRMFAITGIGPKRA